MDQTAENDGINEQPVNKKAAQKAKIKEKLTVRDYITMALTLVLVFIVYTGVGIPMGLTIIGNLFMHAGCALLWGTIFLLLYTKVNKKGTVLIFGIVLALMQIMNFWPTSVFIAVGGLISEIIWQRWDKKRFRTMAICFTVQITFWHLGIVIPILLMSDVGQILAEQYVELYTNLKNFVSGPMFVAGLSATVACCVAGAFLGKLLLKKHFEKAGVV